MAMDENSKTPILILKDMEGNGVLPIWIGTAEAKSISIGLSDIEQPRPMTHDLLLSAIKMMDGKVERVEITRLEEGTFFAVLVVSCADKTLFVDSRPSDAIGVAVRAKCSIFVAEAVLNEAGVPNPVAEAVLKMESKDKWHELLDDLSEDDIKYKM